MTQAGLQLICTNVLLLALALTQQQLVGWLASMVRLFPSDKVMTVKVEALVLHMYENFKFSGYDQERWTYDDHEVVLRIAQSIRVPTRIGSLPVTIDREVFKIGHSLLLCDAACKLARAKSDHEEYISTSKVERLVTRIIKNEEK